METLNDDCICEIAKHMCLKDQVSLFVASSVCQRVLHDLWRRKYKRFCAEDVDKYLTCEEWQIFYENICDSVREMVIDLEMEWKILQCRIYPNVVSLVINSFGIRDQHVSMSKVFPNVTTLKITVFHGGTISPDIFKFKNLKHANLGFYSSDRILEIILKESPLLTSLEIDRALLYNVQWDNAQAFQKFCGLERISVQNLNMPWLRELNKYTKLRELQVRQSHNFEKEFFKNLCKYKQKELIYLQLRSNVPFVQLLENAIFCNLKKLIVEDNYIDHFINISKNASCLRELTFMSCQCSSASVVYHLINSNDSCEYISITKCYFKVATLTLNIGRFNWQRTKPLKLNFSYNEFTYEKEITLNIQGYNRLLTITNNDENLEYPKEIHAKFEPAFQAISEHDVPMRLTGI